MRSPRPVPILRRRPGVRHHRWGTAAVAYVSRLEQDNRFCIACHRPGSRRLHGEHFDRYAATPPVNLSAAHAVARKTVKCRRMILPLRDRECVQCYTDYEAGPFPEGGQAGGRDFHNHPDHRTLSMTCVECHTSHVAGDPRLKFLSNTVVLPRCQRCHKEMGTEQSSG